MTTFPVQWVMLGFGLILGSFLNVCIHRIPFGTFWSSSRSLCPSCGAVIPAYLNVPLLSFAWLRGKAKCCSAKISWRYPLVEVVTGLALVFLYDRFPFARSISSSIDPAELLRFIHISLLTVFLITISFIDWQHLIIPDVLSLPMLALAPLAAWVHPDLTVRSSLLGAALGGGILYGVQWVYWFFRREVGMGFGDVKLIAVLGGWLGWESIAPTLIYASVLGSTYGLIAIVLSRDVGFKTPIPFGPFLGLGSLVHYLFADQMRILWGWGQA